MYLRTEHRRNPAPDARPFEVVERKGIGHPDTMCDMLSEQLSRALANYYIEHYGLVLHHNVDKALLAAGRSEPAFGGGRITAPIDIYLAGRAVLDVEGRAVPVHELAEVSTRAWLRDNMHALDPVTGVRLHCLVRPGSADLVELFTRQRATDSPLANDTSIGAGFAPLTELERVVLAVERKLNAPAFKQTYPETGEDIKVMGLRDGDDISLTVSCAFIGKHLRDLDAYAVQKDHLRLVIAAAAHDVLGRDALVRVNAADDVARGSVFLTVGGTSAEIGDDGQTGRSNRANGLITPYRPMTLEACAGKNPVTHVGKLYNVAASRLAAAIVAEIDAVTGAECVLVSQIGEPVDRRSPITVCRNSMTGSSLSRCATTSGGRALSPPSPHNTASAFSTSAAARALWPWP